MDVLGLRHLVNILYREGGINWCKDSEWFKDKSNGYPYFWNNQDDFEIVIVQNEEEGKLWGYDVVKERKLEKLLKELKEKKK